MKYFLSIINENEEDFNNCIKCSCYLCSKQITHKGAIRQIDAGDVLILMFRQHIYGYGIASKAVEDNEHWLKIPIKDGWRTVTTPFPRPYGVYWETRNGAKPSRVKELNRDWGIEVLLRLKKLRKEKEFASAFAVHLSELAIGFNSQDSYYSIPPVQRGLVWNPTRCEVLWDSILRGIPIGAICLRPANKGDSWEIFDGQQRTNAAAMGYAAWPANCNEPILWIDLAPAKTQDRKFVFRVTTPAHPWGYHLSSDEKKDNRLETWEQREAVGKISGWKNEGKRGARPFTRELWPNEARLPVPFSILRKFVENSDSHGFRDFVSHCREKHSGQNWTRFISEGDFSAPVEWNTIVDAIKKLSEYTVVAINGSAVDDADLGLYFKRMNKQGMEPDDKEIRYSMLKAKIPGLKQLDDIAKPRTRPSRLADLAVRFWLSRKNNWKWIPTIGLKDIATIANDKDCFAAFVKDEFSSLLNELDDELTKPEKPSFLLRWHLCELYDRGDSLILYFLRELAQQESPGLFVPLATTVLWFGVNIQNCAESLWNTSCVQEGLFHAIRQEWLVRWFTKDEIREWARRLKSSLEEVEWGNGDKVFKDPFVGQALNCIWDGFDGGVGCSFLLFVCRAFMNKYFTDYSANAVEWLDQNRPWDYDHILPQDWVSKKRVSGYTYLVQKFLRSIGNSAPLPFSLNRGRQAKAPDNYPGDGDESSAKSLLVDQTRVNQYGQDRQRYYRLEKDKNAASRFVSTTLDRMTTMIEDWYDSCQIDRLVDVEGFSDDRRALFETLRKKLNSTINLPESTVSVWFVQGERQYRLHKPIDWARPWLSCGVCGTIIPSDGNPIPCMLGVASNGKRVELGLRRHPKESSIPGDEWWYSSDETGSSYTCINEIKSVSEDDILDKLKDLKQRFSFNPQ